MITSQAHSSSFRDPSGFLFWQDGALYRQVNTTYKDNYDRLMKSGLYEALTTAGLLIPHEEVDVEFLRPDLAYKVIRPELIPFISYPYEWCFSQLKDAALTTLRIQRTCLDFGMSLKDCSAYNMQLEEASPNWVMSEVKVPPTVRLHKDPDMHEDFEVWYVTKPIPPSYIQVYGRGEGP